LGVAVRDAEDGGRGERRDPSERLTPAHVTINTATRKMMP
jgi:hypothetical protein